MIPRPPISTLSPNTPPSRSRLVVIGIIALLVGILMPPLTPARRQARATTCGSNMRQIGQALIMYADQHKGKALPVWPWSWHPAVESGSVSNYLWDVGYQEFLIGWVNKNKEVLDRKSVV